MSSLGFMLISPARFMDAVIIFLLDLALGHFLWSNETMSGLMTMGLIGQLTQAIDHI